MMVGRDSGRCVRAVVTLALWLCSAAVPLNAQTPADLVQRAARYIETLLPGLSNVVAEERYEQRMTSPNRRRTLVSDFLLVRLEETQDVVGFRDVFSVDGVPVRDREERVSRLFVESPATAVQQASRIMQEGARHNLANIGTVNSPFMPLAFLQARYAPRFRFSSARQDTKMGADVWAFQYEEFVVPTILKGNANRDVPARGRFWVETTTGRVVKWELRLGADSARLGLQPIQVETTFAYDADLRLNLPSEMRESYPDRNGLVSGVATYGRFRRFGVTVEETVR
jgi:hypothetical protein